MKGMGFTVLLVTLLVGQICTPTSSEEIGVRTELPPESESFDESLYATCRMHPSTQLAPGTPRVYGQVLFKQTSPAGKLRVTFRLHGFPTSDPQPRAIHIHQFGDLSGSCASTSGHYNPSGINHPRHPGDFGNFVPRNGKIHYSVDSEATLFGSQSVLGRAVVIHEQEDDLGLGGDAGSLLHGNAGGRMACCVIGMSSPKQWNKFHN